MDNTAPHTRMLRVLMVDDSAPLRERLAGRLVSLGLVEIVGEAGSVPEADLAALAEAVAGPLSRELAGA